MVPSSSPPPPPNYFPVEVKDHSQITVQCFFSPSRGSQLRLGLAPRRENCALGLFGTSSRGRLATPTHMTRFLPTSHVSIAIFVLWTKFADPSSLLPKSSAIILNAKISVFKSDQEAVLIQQ